MGRERKGYPEKPFLREETLRREMPSNQFTDLLRTLPIPTQRARIEFSPNETSQIKNVQAFIEWHQESGFTLTELRKYRENGSRFRYYFPKMYDTHRGIL